MLGSVCTEVMKERREAEEEERLLVPHFVLKWTEEEDKGLQIRMLLLFVMLKTLGHKTS